MIHKDKGILAIKDTVLIALCAAILFVQQLALSFIPNVQFSTLLIVLFAKTLGFKRTTLIIIVHVIVYNILSPLGPVLITHVPFMIAAWLLIPISLQTIFKKMDSSLALAIFGLIFGFVYGWMLIPPAVFISGVSFKAYLIMDIPFEIIMGISNFLTIYWLYEPLKKVFFEQLQRFYHSEKENGGC